MEQIELIPGYSISRMIKGGWQSSQGHLLKGPKPTEEEQLADMESIFESGITTVDFGDIYTGVEELMGRFLSRMRGKYGASIREQMQLHTKYVPDLSILPHHSAVHVQRIVDRSRQRLNVDQIDLVQFHWWDTGVQGYLEAMEALLMLREKGVIRQVGVTNFDLEHLREFVAADLKPLTVQVQYSVLDHRPQGRFTDFCVDQGIHILAYGTVAGGYLSERYLDQNLLADPENRSLVKYRLIIEEFGGPELFQKLLRTMKGIAEKHQCKLATVASAYVLQKRGVAGVIVGAHNTKHLKEHLHIPSLILSPEDLSAIQLICEEAKGPLGPVYDLERHDPRHSEIMHKNNNGQ